MKGSIRRLRERALKALEKETAAALAVNADANAGQPDGLSGDSAEHMAETVEPKKRGAARKYVRVESADVFPDTDVCRLLGLNRRVLMLARKANKRGVDWDAIERHVGMTAAWILKQNPAADLERIAEWAIQPSDGVVSVEVVQHTTNCQKLVCKCLADDKTIVVSVPDASQFLDGEQFDAIEIGGHVRWTRELNQA